MSYTIQKISNNAGKPWQLLDDGLVFDSFDTKEQAEQAMAERHEEDEFDDSIESAIDETIRELAIKHHSNYMAIKRRVKDLLGA